jgi:hypothetical protein
MRVRLVPALLFVFLIVNVYAQKEAQSPEQYLGYKLGAKYTPHHKIVGYFQQVANARPDMVKTEQYGETNEGRPLMLAFIGTPENIRNLEQIRLNNLRLAGLTNDRAAALETMPAIVWLSYNVHGNEPSSSEAAMKTLYALVDPQNKKTAEWLKNMVVVMDPCINPDGRDRYANWQNGVTTKLVDANPVTREHREPWPGGRVNHYYFDLNRDWAWQTQIESKQRMKVYNQWLPQVHVDFHEQGYNEPYYFAPAAEPFHEVITLWQREFQVMIGKNNAKYFDANGWLYFTKERFDLFYPSYGDTYPTYNGAIGMTFEQGGGPRGGKAVVTEDGDTLTLADRLEHHYTTGLSTIEVASINKDRLIKEYRKFFSDGIAGQGEYKTYVVRRTSAMGADGGNIGRYLRNNGITYGFAQTKTVAKGFNFVSGKEENFTVQPDDIVISSYQPKSAMLRVLFEPTSKLSDSATYDITAWSLPYALGLEAYGVREKLPIGNLLEKLSTTSPAAMPEGADKAYAYVIPWNSFGSAALLSGLIQAGIKVRYAEQAFSSNGKTFEKGSLIVTKAANKESGNQLYAKILRAAGETPDFRESIVPIMSGFVDKGYDFGSGNVRVIRAPKVALLVGEGAGTNAAGELWFYMEQELKYPVSLINTTDLAQASISSFDVLIIPDGFYRFMNDKSITDDLKSFVQKGGRLIAFENAVSQMSSLDWAIKKKKEDIKKDDEKNDYSALKKYEDRERDQLRSSIPGAIYKVELDNSHPLGFGYTNRYFTLKQDENLYEFIKDGGWNVGVIKKDSYVSGFAGVNTKQKLKDVLVIGAQDLGRGNIIYFADDPIFRGFWENGKLLLANAIFLVGQ